MNLIKFTRALWSRAQQRRSQNALYRRLQRALADGKARTAEDIAVSTDIGPASIAAHMRQMRKVQMGRRSIIRRRREDGAIVYASR